MRRNESKGSLIPTYARTPLIFVVAAGVLAYYGTKLITHGAAHYDFTLPVDGLIPFVPAFSIIYLLAYAQWCVGLILISREDSGLCRQVLAGEIISKLICLALFIIIPTTMVRAEIKSGDFFSTVTRFIYEIDAADNLFPSIHCLDSWICFRGALMMRKTGKGYSLFTLVFTLLVIASTVLIKQHVIVDVFAGILAAEAGLYLSRKLSAHRIFERIDAALNRT